MLWKLWLYSLSCRACPSVRLFRLQRFKVIKSNRVSVAVSVSAGGFSPCRLLLFRKFLDCAGMLAHMVVWFLRKDSWKKCQREVHRARKRGQRMQGIVFLVSGCMQSFSCNSWCCTVLIKPAQLFYVWMLFFIIQAGGNLHDCNLGLAKIIQYELSNWD